MINIGIVVYAVTRAYTIGEDGDENIYHGNWYSDNETLIGDNWYSDNETLICYNWYSDNDILIGDNCTAITIPLSAIIDYWQ